MSTPAQMFDHELNAVKGWPTPYALDKKVNVAAGQPLIRNGRVCSLDVNAELQLGLACGAMALFALANSDDLDVAGDQSFGGDNFIGQGNDPTVASQPHMPTLVAVGAYELESTEFDDQSSYNPNDCLTAGAPGAVDAGILQPGTAYADTICGVTSDGAYSNENSISMLRFWPVWLPPVAGCPEVSSSSIPA